MINEEQISPDRRLLLNKMEEIERRQIFTDKEAANYLRVSQVTLWRERKAGRLAFRRVGGGKIIYTRQDLLDYLESQKRAAYAAN